MDSDDDGARNTPEYIAGTDPGNSNDVFALAVEPGSGYAALSFLSVTGRTYHLQFNTNLLSGDWSILQGLTITGDNTRVILNYTNQAASSLTYRGHVTRP